jgi:hypothetical protein
MMPGTGLARQVGPAAFFAWKYILPVMILLPINVNTPQKSGKAVASLATDPKFGGLTGKYFEEKTERKSPKLLYNRENALDFWNESVRLTKLSRNETILSI